MTGDPAVRASYLRALLSRCDEFGPPAVAIRERLGDAHQTSIECAGPLVWLPLDADLALQRAIADVLGAARTQEFLLASLREVWAGSVLQPIVQTAVGLFGLHPGSLAKLAPTAWGLLYRDCGVWSVDEVHDADEGRREVDMHLRDLPQACVDESAWLSAVVTVLHALLVLCDRGREGDGTVAMTERDIESRNARFRLAWNA